MNHADFGLSLIVREDTPADGVAATLEGLAVPYGTEIEVGGYREQFAPGAIDALDAIGKPLCWRHDEPIGRITHASSTPDGLHVIAVIADTTTGRDAATLARMGGMGLSVGFTPLEDDTTQRGMVTRVRAALRELSLTHMPAYATAGVGAIREEEPLMETTTSEDTPVVPSDDYARAADVAVLQRQIAAMHNVSTAPEVHPLSEFRSFADYSKAVFEGKTDARALVDQITTNNPGVLPPNWANDVKNIVSHGRPGITALGVESAGASGMDFAWPYYDGDISLIVAAQATQKTLVNSVRIDIKKGTAALATYAAASDVSYQLIMRSSPSYLEAHNRIMAASYATVTDNAFVDALVTGGTASATDYDLAADTDGSKFRAAVFAASMEVETATGAPASVVLVASDVFGKIGGWDNFVPQPYGTQNVPGTATASTLAVSVSGLPVVHDRNLAAGSIVVTNTSAAKWIEDGPMFATAESPTLLGRDVAIYGFGTTAIYNPKGVVKLTNLP